MVSQQYFNAPEAVTKSRKLIGPMFTLGLKHLELLKCDEIVLILFLNESECLWF
jgi:hypothetical protein